MPSVQHSYWVTVAIAYQIFRLLIMANNIQVTNNDCYNESEKRKGLNCR